MQDDIFEKEMRKKAMELLDNTEETFKYLIEAICETWATTRIICYFQDIIDRCKEKRDR